MDSTYRTELQVGEVFDFDLLDNFGSLVLPRGKQVTLEMLADLNRRGCIKVVARRAEDVAALDAAGKMNKPAAYNGSHQRTLDSLAEDGPEIMAAISDSIQQGERIDTEAVDYLVASYDKIVVSDPDVVLSKMLLLDAGPVVASLRSLRMCAMSIVGASQMGYPEKLRRQAGRAALLHDVTLPDDWPRLLRTLSTRAVDGFHPLQDYRQHPFHCADVLKTNFAGVSDLELTLVTQVHEQCDGSGFPRGLKRHILHPLSRLLNLVDAFLTLTDDSHPDGGYVAADALAYLVLHSLYGTFDRDCIQALICSAAVYPVGSDVRLSDSTIGTVVRSSKKNYCQPIVRMHTPDAETVDLSLSKRHIIEPVQARGRRIPKSHLHRTLWHDE